MLRLSRFLDTRFKDGGEVVNLTRRPRSFPPPTFVPLYFWYSFLLGAE
jgi:hypothetical protein